MEKNWIKRAIIGSILIAVVVAGLGFAGYKWAKQYYYEKLENKIVNQYLDGRDVIGAISSNFRIFSVLNPTGCFRTTSGDDMYLLNEVSDTVGFIQEFQRVWNRMEYKISNDDIINILDNTNRYSWFVINYSADNSLNCMVMKRTNRGFDFINETIVGVGFNYFPIGTTKDKSRPMYWIDIENFDLYKQYFNYLVSDVYKGVFFRYENPAQKDKYNLLYISKLFVENEYYELKLDPYYDYIGARKVESSVRNYGNNFHVLYGRTITDHYSIQAKGTVLEDTFLKRTSIAGVGLILAYIIFCAIMNNKKVKS